MKKLWRYVHKKGIRNPMVSTQILDADGFLYFTLCYSDKGFYKTDFVKFDAAKGAGEEIFSENHVCRSCGIYEEDKFYFTSMSGKAYCLIENCELVWSTKIGDGNASFH
ncbi:MAG: hypothetical protein LUC34_03395, partial [Campylobacter sp.]|nr:hypothetical protein [Campylobacter sp.]